MSLTKPREVYRIFVVDDLSHQRGEIKRAIWKALGDCEFVEAGSLPEARAVLDREILPFDLAIIDIRLGTTDQNEDGRILAKEIRKRNPQTAIITVTAFPGTDAEYPDGEQGPEQSFISKLEPHLTERLQTEARTLLRQDTMRASLRLQHEALEQAEKVYLDNEKEWIRKYGGTFVLVVDGKVVASTPDAGELQKVLGDYPSSARCRACVIHVPSK